MALVIVESPTKAKTISGFLGDEYSVKSSYGHIKDLPAKELGVDTEDDFKPDYQIMPKAKDKIKELEKEAENSDEKIILATDEDREGEAIAAHLKEVLEKGDYKFDRIVFHEITDEAISNALENPREIDENLVNAQKARRVLDRLVGYKLSPLLWKKISRGLSAGRVQSVALRFIVEREEEREEFTPKKYWTIEGIGGKNDKTFEVELKQIDGEKLKKFTIESEDEAKEIVEESSQKDYEVVELSEKTKNKTPYPPYITSTLQQDAAHRVYFSAKKTMVIAQQLYEGIEIPDKGQTGLITYMRTDSTNLAQSAIKQAESVIKDEYGDKYSDPTNYKSDSDTAQEAHEAIRPTDFSIKPEDIKNHVSKDQYKLYNLIWKRAVASQMSAVVYNKKKIVLEDSKNKFSFQGSGKTTKFPGFTKVYELNTDEKELPSLEEGSDINIKEIESVEHETQPPARYSEATIVKKLKKHEIGRPSTYATIIDTIQERNYVKKDRNKKFYPTDLGRVVNKLLSNHFPNIVDTEFTAEMESDLDKIAEGKKEWVPIIENFYTDFEERLNKKEEEIKKSEMQTPVKDKECPECGSELVKRFGKYGKFISCSDFPDCSYSESIKKGSGINCPECDDAELIERRTKSGTIFYGCENYPDCEFAVWDQPTEKICPECDEMIVRTKNKEKCSNCDYSEEI